MKIVTLYYSGYGHTQQLAEAFHHELEESEEVEPLLVTIDDGGNITEGQWSLLDEADAIIFGAPTYMGMAPWQFKKFADDTSERWLNATWRNKVAGGMTISAAMNGDKHSTLHYFFTLACQHGMVWANMGMQAANTQNATRNDINYIGAFEGLMAQAPADASPEEAPCQGDLDTAAAYARRVVEVTRQWLR
ncbi:flavodoxin family protein [Salinimonas marina]|uniref:Flavodoxin family protein n=1 Tax=Salinimonas marina TaxID=2785918 RepID=A0A7S9DX86_9ALTE|nr:flavodoxin family protein [Salinimonas marina]QPG05507.1 flavodoxin family protein [Salinimonas marina]